MAVGRISMRLVPGDLPGDLDRATRATPKELTALVFEATERGRTEILKRTPVGHSGTARRGWASEIRRRNTSRVTGLITNPVLHVDPLDTGRKAGRMPPIDALVPWVGSKLGIPPGPRRRSVAFLVARKIGARGTTGTDMIDEGWEVARNQLKPALTKLGLRIVRRL